VRASEICELRWDDIDLRAAAMHVKRLKHGQATTHQVGGDELRALRKLRRDQEPKSAFVFVNERGTPFDRNGFNWMVKRAGKKAGLPFQVHAGQGYAVNPGLPWPQGYQTHGPLHRAVADPVQRTSGLIDDFPICEVPSTGVDRISRRRHSKVAVHSDIGVTNSFRRTVRVAPA
jgi:hypothetical protein